MNDKIGDRVYVFRKKLLLDSIEFNDNHLGTITNIEKHELADLTADIHEWLVIRITLDNGKKIKVKIGDYDFDFKNYKYIKLEALKHSLL